MPRTTDVVVHALLNQIEGVTNEVSKECRLEQVNSFIDYIDRVTGGEWLAITVVHLEDHPKLVIEAGIH